MVLLIILIGPAIAEKRNTYLYEEAFGARALVLGGVVGSRGVNSVNTNPANLVLKQGGWEFLIGGEQKFTLNNWRENQFGFVLPTWQRFRLGGFYIQNLVLLSETSLIEQEQVDNLWSATVYGISGGILLRPGLCLGVSLSNLEMVCNVDSNELVGSVTLANLGLGLKKNNWDFGFAAHKIPLAGDLSTDPDYHFGMAYRLGNTILQGRAIFYKPPEEDKLEPDLNIGLEMKYLQGVVFRIGITKGPGDEMANLNAGLAVNRGPLGLEYAYSAREVGENHFFCTTLKF